MAWHELLDASICIANKNCGMEERSERRRRVEQREKELQEQEMEQAGCYWAVMGCDSLILPGIGRSRLHTVADASWTHRISSS